MKIALIGYGKMGKTIERFAKERGHQIVSIIDIDNTDDFSSEAFKSADVAIEFTAPHVALTNIRSAFRAGVPVVCGTTGWNEHLPALKEEIEANGNTLFWASNFSLGVNIFAAVNAHLAKIMNQFSTYNVEMTEVHHTQKLDAPSGTAITLAESILEHIDRKDSWKLNTENKANEMAIYAIREGSVPGIHVIKYDSNVDFIEIKHELKNRDSLALGAVIAAEFTKDKKGLLGMQDLMNF